MPALHQPSTSRIVHQMVL